VLNFAEPSGIPGTGNEFARLRPRRRAAPRASRTGLSALVAGGTGRCWPLASARGRLSPGYLPGEGQALRRGLGTGLVVGGPGRESARGPRRQEAGRRKDGTGNRYWRTNIGKTLEVRM
jgi:hypothetical protein